MIYNTILLFREILFLSKTYDYINLTYAYFDRFIRIYL